MYDRKADSAYSRIRKRIGCGSPRGTGMSVRSCVFNAIANDLNQQRALIKNCSNIISTMSSGKEKINFPVHQLILLPALCISEHQHLLNIELFLSRKEFFWC